MKQLDGCRGITVEDLTQAGFLALTDAVSGYDPEKGAAFLTYLAYHLHRWFLQTAGLRTEKTARDPVTSTISLDDRMEGGEVLGELQPDPHDSIADAEAEIFRQQLRGALETGIDKYLSESDAQIIRRRYFEGKTRQQIAEDRKPPQSRPLSRPRRSIPAAERRSSRS